jgi:hypothetical protein
MARLTDKTLAQSTAITPTTLIHIVTTADVTQNPAGSSYKAQLSQLASLFTGGTSGSGTSGTSGINGTSGTSGINGTSGTSGIDGTSGTSGINGTSGTSGINGTSGTSGINGTSGTSGINGTSGSSGTSSGGGSSIDPYYNSGSGSTITWNVSGQSTNYEATLTATTTLNLTGVTNGDYGTIIIKQDGVGSRAISLGTVNGGAGTHRVANNNLGFLLLTSNANAIDIATFTYNGSVMYWTVANDFS